MYCVYENTIREYDTNFYNLRNVTTNNHYFLKKLGSKYLKKSKMLQQVSSVQTVIKKAAKVMGDLGGS